MRLEERSAAVEIATHPATTAVRAVGVARIAEARQAGAATFGVDALAVATLPPPAAAIAVASTAARAVVARRAGVTGQRAGPATLRSRERGFAAVGLVAVAVVEASVAGHELTRARAAVGLRVWKGARLIASTTIRGRAQRALAAVDLVAVAVVIALLADEQTALAVHTARSLDVCQGRAVARAAATGLQHAQVDFAAGAGLPIAVGKPAATADLAAVGARAHGSLDVRQRGASVRAAAAVLGRAQIDLATIAGIAIAVCAPRAASDELALTLFTARLGSCTTARVATGAAIAWRVQRDLTAILRIFVAVGEA